MSTFCNKNRVGYQSKLKINISFEYFKDLYNKF